MTLTVEPVTADDWVRWRALRLRALEEDPVAFTSTASDWRAAPEERWRSRLAPRDGACFLARDGDADVGMVAVAADEAGRAVLTSLWVAPEARRAGVAGALLAATRRVAARTGASLLTLEVREDNRAARAFYALHRFGIVGPAPPPADATPPELLLATTVDEDEDDRSAIALAAAHALGLSPSVVRHRPARSLAEAAALRGVRPDQVVKTMVVRVRAGEHCFVLVPGDREIAWPGLRALLAANRLSLADADEARAVTGYVRGTITPLGSVTPLAVVADRLLPNRLSLGGGGAGVALTLDTRALVEALGARRAGVTRLATPAG